jgi:hypothetical protein
MSTPQAATTPIYKGLTRTTKIPACVLDKEDLRKIYFELEGKASEALRIHLNGQSAPPGVAPQAMQRQVQQTLAACALVAQTSGKDGEQMTGATAVVLGDKELPEQIASVRYDSAFAYQAKYSQLPLNRFALTLDFSDPTGLNYNPWDIPTPNGSALEIIGPDETWVRGVHDAVISLFERRRKRRTWLHSPLTYKLVNYLVFFPASFWITTRIDELISRRAPGMHSALRGAIDIYAFLLGLIVFQIAMAAARYLFPLVELKGTRSFALRAGVGTVLVSLFSALLYDVLKALF